MTIEFRCPTCDRLLRTADEKAGAHASCPHCGGDIHVPGEATEFDDDGIRGVDESPPRADSEQVDAEPAAPSAGGPSIPGNMRKCPMCGEFVLRSARKCEFCGERLTSRGTRRVLADADSTMALISLVTGIIGLPMAFLSLVFCCTCINLPVSAAAVICGFIALSQINRGEAEGKAMAVAGIVCGFLGIALIALFLLWQFGGFNR